MATKAGNCNLLFLSISNTWFDLILDQPFRKWKLCPLLWWVLRHIENLVSFFLPVIQEMLWSSLCCTVNSKPFFGPCRIGYHIPMFLGFIIMFVSTLCKYEHLHNTYTTCISSDVAGFEPMGVEYNSTLFTVPFNYVYRIEMWTIQKPIL